MSAVVVGIGLVSPCGRTASEHAFFLRAQVRVACSPAFETAAGETPRVTYCPWLGAAMPLDRRIDDLTKRALVAALAPLREAHEVRGGGKRLRVEVHACVAEDAPAVGEAAGSAARGLGDTVFLHHGPTSAFDVVGGASARLGSSADAVVVAGIDSYIDPARLAVLFGRAPSPWAREPPRPSEAAAAVVLVDAGFAKALGLDVLASIPYARTRPSASRDDNDLAVDGAGLTALLVEMAGGKRVTSAFGQRDVDALRAREWRIAIARARDRFSPTFRDVSLEEDSGRVGAAAGVANLAYGIAVGMHMGDLLEQGSMVAWAIGGDGQRGLCVANVTERGAHG